MKLHALFRTGTFFAAALMTAGCTAAAVSAETESSETEETVETYECGDYVYSRVISADDETVTAARIERYTGSESELVIPSELDGLDVVLLGDYAFSKSSLLTKVTIPKTVTALGTYTFAECTQIQSYEVEEGNPALESRGGVLYTDGGATLLRYPTGAAPADLVMENGVDRIASAAFTGCRQLETIKLSGTLESIGDSAFAECISLTSIEIPASVTSISDFAFNSCTALTEVKLYDGLKSIGAGAFTSVPITSITLPETLITIGEQAFCNTKLTEVTIPRSVQEIGYTAFGWSYNAAIGELVMDKSFIIRGAAGSAAQTYAIDTENGDGFPFEEIDVEPLDSSSEADETTTAPEKSTAAPAPIGDGEKQENDHKLVRIVGLSACGVLLILIAAVAIRSGKKKKTDDAEDSGDSDGAEEDASEEKEETADEDDEA